MKPTRSKIIDALNLAFSIVGMLYLFFNPQNCIEAAKDGLYTALYIALPSIFPFMVLSKFIISGNLHHYLTLILGKLFKFIFGVQKKCVALFILGCLGGYPVGAVTANEMLMKGEISKSEAEHMLGFCNNCGPMFVIGTVGTILLNNTKYGYILYATHLISVIFAGIAMRILFKPDFKESKYIKSSCKQHSPLISSITNSTTAIINVSGYIIIFSVISDFVMKTFNSDSMLFSSAVLGALEITNGIKYISSAPFTAVLKMSLISAAIGFSGLCVIAQSRAVFENNTLSFKKYLICKVMISFFSFILSYLTFSVILT